MKKIEFGTGGFRGVIGNDFTKENIQGVCQAVCNIIKKQNKKKLVCIGYDNRFMSEHFAVWCAEVFAGNDISVELCDSATSTPVVMYASKLNKNDFGVMITASHNPYEYNGIKVFVEEGKDAGIETTKLIEQEMENIQNVICGDYAELLGNKIKLVNYIESYVDNIIKALDLQPIKSNFNVVFDAKHGSAVSAIHAFAKKINLQNYTIINDNRDAFFSFKTPAPSISNIEELKNTVIKNNAYIGFALDADGDRLAVVDENGNYIDNNYILAVAYYFLVKYCKKRGSSVKNVATSNLLDTVTKKLGYECIEVPVGFKYISSAIIQENAVIGGESSGGLAVDGHIWGKDSLLAIALCLKATTVMNKSFSQILNEVLTFADGYTKVISDQQYSYTKKQKEYIDKLLFTEHELPIHRYQPQKTVVTDYIKQFYTNGNWSLVRFSGTEPILRIFAEADTLEESLTMIEDWKNLLGL